MHLQPASREPMVRSTLLHFWNEGRPSGKFRDSQILRVDDVVFLAIACDVKVKQGKQILSFLIDMRRTFLEKYQKKLQSRLHQLIHLNAMQWNQKIWKGSWMIWNRKDYINELVEQVKMMQIGVSRQWDHWPMLTEIWKFYLSFSGKWRVCSWASELSNAFLSLEVWNFDALCPGASGLFNAFLSLKVWNFDASCP